MTRVATTGKAAIPPGKNKSAALAENLALVSWFSQTLGYSSNEEMLSRLGGYRTDWSSGCHDVLARWRGEADTGHSFKGKSSLADELTEIDHAIQIALSEINKSRGESRVSLKYFQYLAAQASFLCLKRMREDHDGLISDINRLAKTATGIQVSTISKLAFWMATGSGKTLLMHFHYKAFLKYGNFKPNNILLITPNERLSEQHMQEMRKSGVPCARYDDNSLLGASRKPATVKVIEITKFASEKNGRARKKAGVSPKIFEGPNLVFVDEGHKGSGGEQWFAVRDKLVMPENRKNGFTFEYSATYGQALDARLLNSRKVKESDREKRDRAEEYAGSILTDYSYPHFHGDGYGKAFRVIGLTTSDANRNAERLLLLGNLLMFFEQMQIYRSQPEMAEQYQVERPLLLLLGRTVSSETSSILSFLRFLDEVASDRKGGRTPWLASTVGAILDGTVELPANISAEYRGGRGNLLRSMFPRLAERFEGDAEGLVRGLSETLFGTGRHARLRLTSLRSCKGEVALRVGDSEPFGLVNIDGSKVSELIRHAASHGMKTDEDLVGGSLFASAHEERSGVNILVGAKKFMEGWSSWRVSSIGLLDVGQSEGTEIVQLFGRGVRLKGFEWSLKRTEARECLPHFNHEELRLLQTLNVFAIRSNFMANFQAILENEGGMFNARTIPTKKRAAVAHAHKLMAPSFPHRDGFEEIVSLEHIPGMKTVIDLGTVGSVYRGGTSGGIVNRSETALNSLEYSLPKHVLESLNEEQLYIDLVRWKQENGHWNLFIDKAGISAILNEGIKVKCPEGHLDEMDAEFWAKVQTMASNALCNHARKLFQRALKKWEMREMRMSLVFDAEGIPGSSMRGNMPDYNLIIPGDNPALIEDVDMLLDDLEKTGKGEPWLYTKDVLRGDGLKRMNPDIQLAIPLLLEQEDAHMSPKGLNAGEKLFVIHLRAFLLSEEGKPWRGRVFLLRNNSKGMGIGFYDTAGFYPDFILWVLGPGDESQDVEHQPPVVKQRVIFVEPHGMVHGMHHPENDEKVQLARRLRELSRSNPNISGSEATLDSYIVSETEFDILKWRMAKEPWRRCDFTKRHILFAKDGTAMIRRIIEGDDASNSDDDSTDAKWAK